MKKKIFALILALLCLTAVPALAVWELYLGVVDIIANPSGEIGGGTYAYDIENRTLTLNNVHLSGGAHLLLERGEKELLKTIVLVGENTINATDMYAINVYGDTTFTGEGSLTVTAPFAPIFVEGGDLIIDGVDIAAQDSMDYSAAVFAEGVQIDDSDYSRDGKVEIRNGGSLTAKSNGANFAVLCGSRGGILVTDGSRLAIDSRNTNNDRLYPGSLTVSDTSSAEILSVYGGLRALTTETAETAVLTAEDGKDYDLSFNKGSEPYIFTVTQTAMEDGRNLVNIIGEEKFSGVGEGTATPAPMPETGDESHPVLWAAMLLTAAVWFATRKRANA